MTKQSQSSLNRKQQTNEVAMQQTYPLRMDNNKTAYILANFGNCVLRFRAFGLVWSRLCKRVRNDPRQESSITAKLREWRR